MTPVNRSLSMVHLTAQTLLQKPLSNPTEKQLLSWLKEADTAVGLLTFSIAGLVFIVEECGLL